MFFRWPFLHDSLRTKRFLKIMKKLLKSVKNGQKHVKNGKKHAFLMVFACPMSTQVCQAMKNYVQVCFFVHFGQKTCFFKISNWLSEVPFQNPKALIRRRDDFCRTLFFHQKWPFLTFLTWFFLQKHVFSCFWPFFFLWALCAPYKEIGSVKTVKNRVLKKWQGTFGTEILVFLAFKNLKFANMSKM